MTKIALIHEWLTTLAGSEKVLEQLCHLFPDAPLHVVQADADLVAATPFLRDRTLRTSFIQRLPGARRHFRRYLPLMPLAIEQFDMSAFDVVISSHHAVAKGVLTGPDQLHISYVHTPMRYAWDLQHQYLRDSGLDHGIAGWIVRWLLHRIRIWDHRSATGVDHFIANSHFIARRIRKAYGREADVIYPPVDIRAFMPVTDKQQHYVAASRMVPYKRMRLIVEAFSAMPERELVVIGDGPELECIRAMAGPNIRLTGRLDGAALCRELQQARAFVFAAEEDFGIMPVEAQACGTPVIAFGKGGALETIRGLDHAEPTGVFFPEQSAAAIRDAVARFEANAHRITARACRENAERFSCERFRQEISDYVARRSAEFASRRQLPPQ